MQVVGKVSSSGPGLAFSCRPCKFISNIRCGNSKRAWPRGSCLELCLPATNKQRWCGVEATLSSASDASGPGPAWYVSISTIWAKWWLLLWTAASAVLLGALSIYSGIKHPSVCSRAEDLRNHAQSSFVCPSPYTGASAFLPHVPARPLKSVAQSIHDAPFARANLNLFTQAGDNPLTERDLSLNEAITYRFQQIVTGSTVHKLGFVLALCLPYILASAAFYRSLSSESWFNSIYKSYCTLFRTPGSVNKETSAGPAIVLNIVFLYGLFFFAVFLGLITEDIKGSVGHLREGLTPVAETGHVVVCNWNDSTPALLRQLALAKMKATRGTRELGEPVVVLACRSKPHMDLDIEQEVHQKAFPLKVETRRGMPHKLADLRRVRVSAASTVFVMQPEGTTFVQKEKNMMRVATASERDALKASTALQINAMTHLTAKQQLILQDTADHKEVGYVRKFQQGCREDPEKGQSVLEPLDENVATCLTAQTACRPGLVNVTTALLTYSNHAERLQYVTDPCIAGSLYGDVRRLATNAVVVGYQRADGSQTKLNPSDWDRMESGDRILVVSKDSKCHFSDTPTVSEAECGEARAFMVQKCVVTNPSRHVIVLNWCEDPADLIAHFGNFSPPGTEVVFVNMKHLPMQIPDKVGNAKFRQVINNNVLDREALIKAGLKKADAVVMGADRELQDEAHDAQIISNVMVLQHQYEAASCSRRLHIVAPITDPDTLPVINHILHNFGAAKKRLLKASPESRSFSRTPNVAAPNKVQNAEQIGASNEIPVTGQSPVHEKRYSEGRHVDLKTNSEQDHTTGQDQRIPSDTLKLDTVSTVPGPKRAGKPPASPPVHPIPAPVQASEIEDVSDMALPLSHVITAELFLPRDFSTGLLVHVAQEPELVHVLQDLFDETGGHAIFLRSSRFFRINPDVDPAVKFSRIVECARARGETAIGIMTREGDLRLAPPANFKYLFRNGDRVVVISDHPWKRA